MSDELNQELFTFKDRKGREWDVTITLRGAMRIERGDYSEILDEPVSMQAPSQRFIREITTNSYLIGSVVWHLIHPQAEAQGVTEDDFIDSLDGTAIADAKAALWGALGHFFPELKTGLSRLVDVQRRSIEKLAKLTDELVETKSKALDQFIEVEVEKASTEFDKMLTTGLST